MVEDSHDADRETFLDGMGLFTRANAPWTALADENKWERSLDTVRALDADLVLSSDAPAARDRAGELIDTVKAPSMDLRPPEEDIDVETVLIRYETGRTSIP